MIPHIFAPNERDAETAESWQEFQIIAQAAGGFSYHTGLR
jgi:hypothetical protein